MNEPNAESEDVRHPVPTGVTIAITDYQIASVRYAGDGDGRGLEIGMLVAPQTAFIFDHAETPGWITPYKIEGVGLIRKGDIIDRNSVRKSHRARPP